jgi:hypothetical protein
MTEYVWPCRKRKLLEDTCMLPVSCLEMSCAAAQLWQQDFFLYKLPSLRCFIIVAKWIDTLEQGHILT